MFDDTRQASIVAQVSVKAAVELVGPGFAGDNPTEGTLDLIRELADGVQTIIYDLTGTGHMSVEGAANVAQAAFPGAQEVPQAPAPAPQAPAPQPQQAPAPQPVAAGPGIGPDSTNEELWADVFAHPDDWQDMRVTKTNPAAPDFKHKRIKDGKFFLGLWINGRNGIQVPPQYRAQLGLA